MENVRVAPSCRLPSTQAAAVAPEGWWVQAHEQVLGWLERARQRRQLAQLGDHMLKDIGLTRADVEGEVSKPFWRP